MRRLLLRSALPLFLVLEACSPSASRTPPRSPESKIGAPAEQVSQEQFASVLPLVLRQRPGDARRAAALPALVTRQLERARDRLAAGKKDSGLAAFRGALLLTEADEQQATPWAAQRLALESAVDELARLGDEGQSEVAYRWLLGVLPAGDMRMDTEQHLSALNQWMEINQSVGGLRAAGFRQRVAARRALLDDRSKVFDEAVAATVAWIKLGASFDLERVSEDQPSSRDEAMEAVAALRTGSATLLALCLRRGEPGRALEIIEGQGLNGAMPAPLVDRVERAAKENDPQAWADLYNLFDDEGPSDSRSSALDPQLADAAAWGAALGLYRSRPEDFAAAQPLASELVRRGMADAAMVLLAETLDVDASRERTGFSMGLLLRSLLLEEDKGTLAGARRIWQAAQPIFERAAADSYRGMKPGAGELALLMGTLELRAANPAGAQPLVQRATELGAGSEAWRQLAEIRAHLGDAKGALSALDSAIALARQAGSSLAEAELLVRRYELMRLSGEADTSTALDEALRRSLSARLSARSRSDTARAERVFTRALEGYDARPALRRATERAISVSATDTSQLSATLLDAGRRGLVTGDLSILQTAAREADSAGLADEDVLYIALWLWLGERAAKEPSDGFAERLFGRIANQPGWIGHLAAWAAGTLDAEGLRAAAKDAVQRTEADFYTTMASGQTGTQDERYWSALDKVAHSDALELIEVDMARNFLRQRASGAKKPALPADVTLP